MTNPMMPNPEAYFDQWLPKQKDALKRLEDEAREEEIPIVGLLVGQLLSLLVRSGHCRRILELGTANGYSALWMAYALMEADGHITTIEYEPEMAQKARRHFEVAGVEHLIDIVEGDARTVLSDVSGPFDFIFMDIEKEFYHEMVPLCTRLLKKGSLMVVDNTGFKDADAFNHAIAQDDHWLSVNFLAHLPGHSPVKDGICLALRV